MHVRPHHGRPRHGLCAYGERADANRKGVARFYMEEIAYWSQNGLGKWDGELFFRVRGAPASMEREEEISRPGSISPRGPPDG